jgi:predicted nucleic acid-binding Zn finger protein
MAVEPSIRSESLHGSANTRELRALELYHERGRDIERISPHVYLVPSCTGEGVYRVDYAAESCSCPDHEIRGEVCKHILAVGILRAKRRGALEDQLAHELMEDEERQELRDRILHLRRRLSR